MGVPLSGPGFGGNQDFKAINYKPLTLPLNSPLMFLGFAVVGFPKEAIKDSFSFV